MIWGSMAQSVLTLQIVISQSQNKFSFIADVLGQAFFNAMFGFHWGGAWPETAAIKLSLLWHWNITIYTTFKLAAVSASSICEP